MPQKRRDLEHMRRTMSYVKNKPDGASFGINLGGIGESLKKAGQSIRNAFGGGGGSQPEAPAPPTPPTPETPNEESSNDSGPGFMGMLRAIREKIAAAKAAAMKNMGGAGENVVIRGKMTKGSGMSGLGFRPHFKGGFGADVQQGASMKGGPGGRKKPTANTMKSESTGVAKPKGWGHEQLKTDAVTDHVLGMRDMGFYSNKYAMDRISGKMGYPASTYETVRHPGAKSTAVEKTIAKGPKKPKSKQQSEMKMLRSVKGIEPQKKLMATKTKAKAKAPLKKMTSRPAKKLSTKKR
tara:strand:- start:1772 stop:2656 length:885 start_codon:yes stop_codon:yes gene_type:complete